MENPAFRRWCVCAVDRIRFRPDRERVRAELYAHLEDRCAAFVEAGLPPAEAEKRALAAMGSAEETARQLGEIHRPFWGYFLRAARVLLVLAALAALFVLPRWIRSQGLVLLPGGVDTQWIYSETAREVCGVDYTRTFYGEPKTRAFSDGYRFTLTRAAAWHAEGVTEDGAAVVEDSFYLTVEAFNPRPWAQQSGVLRSFYAVDSLGNVYGAFDRCGYNGKSQTLAGNSYRTGLCVVTWELWLSGYRAQGADWIELRYDRAGRDVRLRVDLRGGDAP